MRRVAVILKKSGTFDQDSMVSLVYRILAAGNREVAASLHDTRSKFKPFVFAGEDHGSTMSILFSSVRPEITGVFAAGVANLRGNILAFEAGTCEVSDIVPITDFIIRQNRIKVKTASPIVLSRCTAGKKDYILYRHGKENDWLIALKRNLAKRYLALCGEEREPEEITVLSHGRAAPVLYKGGKVLARHMALEIRGCPELLETTIYGGIGERTGSGFGMVFPI